MACFIAKRVADARGWGFALVHINTGVRLPGVGEYVRQYADWLGARLIELHASVDYWDGVKKWGYPHLWHNRWCFNELKKKPFYEFAKQHIKPIDLVVMGVRQSESLFRLAEFNKVFYRYCHSRFGVCLNYWLPVLRLGDADVERLLKAFNIPRSPVWDRVGISGECMCMAGMTRRTLTKVIASYPEYAMEMARKDEEVQKVRVRVTYPAPLYRYRVTLSQYVREVLSHRIDQWLFGGGGYVGKSCQGSCIIGLGDDGDAVN